MACGLAGATTLYSLYVSFGFMEEGIDARGEMVAALRVGSV
jgi:hypothetical protein